MSNQFYLVVAICSAFIIGGIVSVKLRAYWYKRNNPQLEALCRHTAQACFLVSFIPLGLWFALHFEIDTIVRKIAPGPAIVTLVSGMHSLYTKSGSDMAKPTNAILFWGLGLLAGLLLGIVF